MDNVDLATTDETGQVSDQEPADVSESASEAPPTQVPDLASVKVRVGEGPDGEMSVEQLRQSYIADRASNAMSRQELAEYKRRMKWAEDFARDVTEQPGLRQHLESWYNRSREEGGGRASVTPESIRLQQLEVEVASFHQDREMGALERELQKDFGIPLSDTQKAYVYEQLAQYPSGKIRDIFWGRFGAEIVKQSRKVATTETADKMAKNAASYRAPEALATTPHVRSAEDVKMFSDEWNDMVTKDIARRMNKR